MLKLDRVGKAYVKVLKSKMENLGTYQDGDDKILLEDIGLQYQLYRKSLEDSLTDKESQKLQMTAQRYYKNVMDMVHRLGLTPTRRGSNIGEKESKAASAIDGLEEYFGDK